MFQGGGSDKCQKLWIDQGKQRLKKKSPLDFATRRSLETWEEQFWRSNRGKSETSGFKKEWKKKMKVTIGNSFKVFCSKGKKRIGRKPKVD